MPGLNSCPSPPLTHTMMLNAACTWQICKKTTKMQLAPLPFGPLSAVHAVRGGATVCQVVNIHHRSELLKYGDNVSMFHTLSSNNERKQVLQCFNTGTDLQENTSNKTLLQQLPPGLLHHTVG